MCLRKALGDRGVGGGWMERHVNMSDVWVEVVMDEQDSSRES